LPLLAGLPMLFGVMMFKRALKAEFAFSETATIFGVLIHSSTDRLLRWLSSPCLPASSPTRRLIPLHKPLYQPFLLPSINTVG
jgi:hypothetical protein